MYSLRARSRRLDRLWLLIAILVSGCAFNTNAASPVDVMARYPHDSSAFTQGLLYYDGALFESTGQYGDSELRRVEPTSGRVIARHRLPSRYFGEGLARIDDRLYQLTWKAGIAFVYDVDTLAVIDQVRYDGQGWGLARWRDDRLVMSDGSAELRFIDPATFTTQRRVTVTDHGRPVRQLNELETVGDAIWANVWHSDRILCIDPQTGHVVDTLDASALAETMPPTANVLNGIAHDAQGDRLFITGKYWPALFEITRQSE